VDTRSDHKGSRRPAGTRTERRSARRGRRRRASLSTRRPFSCRRGAVGILISGTRSITDTLYEPWSHAAPLLRDAYRPGLRLPPEAGPGPAAARSPTRYRSTARGQRPSSRVPTWPARRGRALQRLLRSGASARSLASSGVDADAAPRDYPTGWPVRVACGGWTLILDTVVFARPAHLDRAPASVAWCWARWRDAGR
jgi:hypothetical protein